MTSDETMTSPLIDVDSLAASFAGDTPPVLLDVRWTLAAGAQPDEYERAHLPGARFVDLDRELADPPGAGGRHPLPDPDRFVDAMRAAGIDDDSAVVCYDAGTGAAASRAWWLLQHVGLAAVRVLDGGLNAWRDAGRPLQSGPPEPIDPGSLTVRTSLVRAVDADEAADLAGDGRLLDAREAERFLGRSEPIDPVAGRIPGAANLPTTQIIDDRGRFISADALLRRLDAAGVDPSGELAVYCGSGITAAQEIVALRSAGIDAGLYVGSWSHWITDPDRPVATG